MRFLCCRHNSEPLLPDGSDLSLSPLFLLRHQYIRGSGSSGDWVCPSCCPSLGSTGDAKGVAPAHIHHLIPQVFFSPLSYYLIIPELFWRNKTCSTSHSITGRLILNKLVPKPHSWESPPQTHPALVVSSSLHRESKGQMELVGRGWWHEGKIHRMSPVSVITMIWFILPLQSNINPYLLCQRKWLFLRNLLVTIQGLGVQQSELWGRGQREEGRRSPNTRQLQRLSNTGNPVTKLCSFSCSVLSLDISQWSGFHQAVLDGWGWDWEEKLMSLVLTVQPCYDWQ